MFNKVVLSLLTLLLLSACSAPVADETLANTVAPAVTATDVVALQLTATSAPTTATSLPSPAVLPEESAVVAQQELPTPVPVPTGIATSTVTVAEPAPVQVISGRTPEGAFFLGDENAPLTIIDYSDFL